MPSIIDEYQTPVSREVDSDTEDEKSRVSTALPELTEDEWEAFWGSAAVLEKEGGTEEGTSAPALAEMDFDLPDVEQYRVPSSDVLSLGEGGVEVPVDNNEITADEVARAEATIEDMGTWRVGFGNATIDTGWELDADWASYLVGVGETIQSGIDGVKQILGIDEDGMQTNARFVRALGESEEYGGNLLGGQLTGYVAEPLSFLMPIAKVGKALSLGFKIAPKTVKSSAITGAVAGAAFGFIDYVDEETGESRINNVALGTILGGAIGGAIGKVTRMAMSKDVVAVLPDGGDATGVLNKKLIKANDVISTYEEEVARQINNGLSEAEAMGAVAKLHPKLVKNAQKYIVKYGEAPDFKARSKNLVLEDEVERLGAPAEVVEGTIAKLGRKALGGREFTAGKEFKSGIAELTTLLGTQARKISPQFHARLMDRETILKVYPEKLRAEVAPLERFFPTNTGRTSAKVNADHFGTAQIRSIKKFLFNEDFDGARKLVKESKGVEALDALNRTIRMLEREGQEGVKLGIIDPKTLIKDFWPRWVTPDKREAFLTVIEKRQHKWKKKGAVDKLVKGTLEDYEAHLEKIRAGYLAKGRTLSAYDENQIFSKYFLSDTRFQKFNSKKASRTIKKIDDELLDLYADPIASTHNFIHSMTRERGLLAVFGKTAYRAGDDAAKGSGVFDVETAVETFFSNESAAGIFTGLDKDAHTSLRLLTKTVLGQGMSQPSQAMKLYKSVVASTYIGNPLTAYLQLGDMAVANYAYGLKSSAKGFALAMQKDASKKVTMAEFNLVRYSQEFEDIIDDGVFSTIQEAAFKVSGFNRLDRLGKETFLNSSLIHYKKVAKNVGSADFRRFRRKYEMPLGTERFNKLVKDLNSFNTSKEIDVQKMPHNIQALLVTELSDHQPITQLDRLSISGNKYGQVATTLKSFMFKHMDIIRRDMYDEVMLYKKTGDKVALHEAIRNLFRYVGTVGLGNWGVYETLQIIKGEVPFEDLKDTPGGDALAYRILRPVLHPLKMLNVDEYLIGDMQQGGFFTGVGAYFLPPVPLVDNLLRTSSKADPEWVEATLTSLPYFGPLIRAGVKQAENPDSILNNIARDM
jgi:hypothetical protein